MRHILQTDRTELLHVRSVHVHSEDEGQATNEDGGEKGHPDVLGRFRNQVGLATESK